MEYYHNPGKALEIEVAGERYLRHGIRTHFVEVGEDYLDLFRRYVVPVYRPGDWVAVSEKVAALCQGRVIHRQEIQVTWLARLLAKCVRQTPAGPGMGLPVKMQFALDQEGRARVLWAALRAGVDKLRGIHGTFYRLLGPEVRVVVGHGKMGEQELSAVMQAMVDGEADILVCTTIIETGIDIPNANTLIIEDADHLGLAQLHQIRGRVGRSSRRAYAYLTYRRGKVLTEVAAKRLSAIREFAEFGSGFKIAMRDLEIRGAGNVLGPEQSGFLVSVGYDMYLKLLEEAVLEQKGEAPKVPAECSADLTVAASIPDRYVPSPEQRMDLYRRIARIRSEAEADDLVDELVDRYGDPPRPVNNLISVALLRAAAAKCGITEIAQRGERLNFTLRDPDLARVSAIAGRPAYRGRLLFSAGDKPYLSLKVKKGEDPVKLSSKLIEEYGAAAP